MSAPLSDLDPDAVADSEWEVVSWRDAFPDWNTILHFFNLFSWYFTTVLGWMTRVPVRVVGGGTAIVAASFLTYQYFQHRQNTRTSKLPRIGYPTVSSSRLDSSPEAQQRQKWIQKFDAEARKNDEEREEKRRLRMSEVRVARQAEMMRLLERSREDDVRRLQMRRESEERLEKRHSDARFAHLLREQSAELEARMLETRRKAEMARHDEELQRAREQYRRELEEVEERARHESVRFRRREAEQSAELEEENRRSGRRIQEIRDRFARDVEEMQRRAAERRREMDRLWTRIRHALRMRVWNDVCESNWTRHLTSLRASNTDVRKAYSQLKRSLKSSDAEAQVSKETVLAALDIEKRLMEQEAVEMDRLYRETDKSFLIAIRDAVEQVGLECDRMAHALKNANTVETDRCFSDLEQAALSIPTLADLKRNYAERMGQGSD